MIRFLGSLFVSAVFVCGSGVQAAVKTEVVEYKDGKTTLEGFLAYDDSVKSPRPAVLIVHQWMGISDHEKERAQRLAEKGYVAFVMDIYGKDGRPTSPQEAKVIVEKYRNGDRKNFQARELVAYNWIKKDKRVNSQKIVVMGFCFGGTGALELGRSGASLAGIASFHGGLSNPSPVNAKNLKSPVLVMHGELDPSVPPAEVAAFKKEMDEVKADYQVISYANAVHAFTQKSSGNDNSKGAAYNQLADQRSWVAFMDFLNEVAPIK